MRILMVNSVAWRRELGAARPQLELAEELQALGHDVDHFDRLAAFGTDERPGRLGRLVTGRFARAARRFVTENARAYDVVDAVESCLPYTKGELGFDGLLVARSVGFHPVYAAYLSFERRTWPELARGTAIGRTLVRYEWRAYARACRRQLSAADLVKLETDDELEALRGIGFSGPAIVEPPGISDVRLEAFAEAAAPATERLQRQEIAFVGSWTLRKGRADWPRIVAAARERLPGVRFLLLGTWVRREDILRDLGLPADCDFVEVVPEYDAERLPELLARSTVGAFPSYAEGFGIGALELLAAGLPTVAFDVPGPRTILSGLVYDALVPAGDATELVRRLVELLTLGPSAYALRSAECIGRAERFRWRGLAESTAAAYEHALTIRVDGQGP